MEENWAKIVTKKIFFDDENCKIELSKISLLKKITNLKMWLKTIY